MSVFLVGRNEFWLFVFYWHLSVFLLTTDTPTAIKIINKPLGNNASVLFSGFSFTKGSRRSCLVIINFSFKMMLQIFEPLITFEDVLSKYLAQTGRKPTWIEKQFDELFSYGHILLHSVSMPLTSKIFLNILRIYQTLILSYKKNDTTGCPPEYDVIYYYRLLIDSLGTQHIFNKKCFF